MGRKSKGSVSSAIGWMFLISLLLFWLPVIGPFIAGIVGGKKAGNVGSAIIAVFLPALVHQRLGQARGFIGAAGRHQHQERFHAHP